MSDTFKRSNQLSEYLLKQNDTQKEQLLTTSFGTPVSNRLNTLTIGPHGPIPFQDILLYEEISRFDRERVPERVVHAKGAGAFGYFEVTHADISKYTKASVFEHVGKRTPVAVRFSFVTGEKGQADTCRDPRGFAIKFYTQEGIWDLVANNTPLFFIRDPLLFPMLIHSNKRNPVTNLKDKDMFWDFLTLRNECVHQLTVNYFGDRGIPDGYRHMNGYGSNTFKLVSVNNEAVWCKFHLISDQGIRNLTPDQADLLAGTNPDYATQDLYESIENNNYPSWTMYIQIMTSEQANKCAFNPFDVTKVWPKSEYPRVCVGKLILNKNARNYFAEIEQIAFSPSHMIPGIEASPDKMLQARLFSYTDTQYHRLGPNHLQLPVNTCPFTKIRTYQIDGLACYTDNNDGAPTYYPNSFGGPKQHQQLKQQHDSKKYSEHKYQVNGILDRYDTQDEDNYTQCRVFWQQVLDEDEKNRLCNNIAEHLSGAKQFLQERAIQMFKQVDDEYANRIVKFLELYKSKTNPTKTC